MKSTSLITAGLMAVGLVSSASANTYVYLTGSTALRATVYNAMINNEVMTGTSVVSTGSNTGSGANDIVYEGTIGTTTYDVVCEWTGSEAGIASCAGLSSLANPTPANPASISTGTLPGVPPTYLIGPAWTTKSAAGTYATDLDLADTSQAVSLTKNQGGTSPTNLKSYGTVGIVTFEWVKGYNSIPGHISPSWGHITGVTTPELKSLINGVQVPRLFTGNSSTVDPDTDKVVAVGRNIGSGTHANTLLEIGFAVTHGQNLYAPLTGYNSSDVLTFNGTDGNGTVGAFTDAQVFNCQTDGFDSGSKVAACLKCDSVNSHYILLGYLGLSDAATAIAGGAVALPLDGVAESNSAVENAQYPFWGHEHLYGKEGQLTTDAGGIVGAALYTGIPAELVRENAGVAAAGQDPAIPVSLMHADKGTGSDSGYPTPQ